MTTAAHYPTAVAQRTGHLVEHIAEEVGAALDLSRLERLVMGNHTVDSPWFDGLAAVPSFDLPELIATKIRSLLQRSKGRDLFDLWLAVRHAVASPDDIASCFEPFRPDGWSANRALENLNAKLVGSRFIHDLDTPTLRRSPHR